MSLSSTFKDILEVAQEVVVKKCESQAGESLSYPFDDLRYPFDGLGECDALDDLVYVFWTHTERILSQNRNRSFINRMVILLHFFPLIQCLSL